MSARSGKKKIPAETEVLKVTDRINEYILTTLRTDTGCNLAFLKNSFDYDVSVLHGEYLRELQINNLVFQEDGFLKLTDAGKLLADKISSDLFSVE